MPNLEKRRQLWYALLTVPEDARKTLGRLRFRKSTGTSNRREAAVVAAQYVAGWTLLIKQARGGNNPHLNAAIRWRADIEKTSDALKKRALKNRLLDEVGKIEESTGFPNANDNEVAAFIDGVPLIIAHNAKFDRPFVESRFPIFQNQAWACSFAQIPWNDEGLSSAKQEFLAYRFGFHYDGHRASNDCQALLEILQQTLPESGTKALRRLLESVAKKELKVSPLNSPFESKDLLKERGYRWNPEQKLWSGIIASESLENEAEWLKAAVYSGRAFKLEQEMINAKNRFSARKGAVEIVNY